LTEHATQREFIYSHKWQEDDALMWDDRQVMHRGRSYAAEEARVRRTTVKGDAPTMEQAVAP
jgi:alpha-ketoglutarate-dependent 2,4-dichlorophenoxyacetate dioxygenase